MTVHFSYSGISWKSTITFIVMNSLTGNLISYWWLILTIFVDTFYLKMNNSIK